MLAYLHLHPEAVVALGTALSGAAIVGVSWIERSSRVVKWRMKRSLLHSKFYEANIPFSSLKRSEKPFHRPELLTSLVNSMKSCFDSDFKIFIVGAVRGCGKSVFWERVLSLRPLSSFAVPPTDPEALQLHEAWDDFAGPTRVVNLLDCTTIDIFKAEVLAVFHPKPWLPNFSFRPDPTAESCLKLLKSLLMDQRFEKNPLIVFVEDANRFPRFAASDMDLVTDFFNAFHRNTLIVGNSSSVLAFRNFQKLSHHGARSRRYFFPTIAPSDPQLIEFVRCSGHLYSDKSSAALTVNDAVASDQIAMWGGNLLLLKPDSVAELAIKHLVEDNMKIALTDFGISETSHHFELISQKCKKDEPRVLLLRRQLLQRLVDEYGKVRVDSLSKEIREFKIHLQLAALDLLSFRTEYDEKNKVYVEYVIPYYPYVLTAFRESPPPSTTL